MLHKVTNPPVNDPSGPDTSRPHPVRIYDYWLGGKDNFAADRELGDAVLASVPTVRTSVRENRAFLSRVVNYLVAEAGIRQFLDIGTGLPTVNSVHEVAQAVIPSARVVYVDNDPQVLAHARALLRSAPEGRTAYVQADLRDPEGILNDPAVREVLDFSQPVAVMLLFILHLIPDSDRPEQLIRTLFDALPAGSYLASSHASGEHQPEASEEATRAARRFGVPGEARDSADFARIAFSGLEMVPPGVTLVSEWRPKRSGPRPTPAEVSCYGGLARKP
jgi:hypothetical protein